ncbi:MAG TPA: hypothetical protein VMI31_11215 [Fimbriimonadaceae bacterium]|nr:hypothetical protein [Fimbriimonadaceae bacterium]
MKPPKPIYSYLSAAALALVTIVTFAVFQNYGPQSAIRRFMMDVASRHFSDLASVAEYSYAREPNPMENEKEQLGHMATDMLAQEVASYVAQDASYEIVGLNRLPGGHAVQATVEYQFPNGFRWNEFWYVVQTSSDWRVDCEATSREFRRYFGSPNGDVDPLGDPSTTREPRASN